MRLTHATFCSSCFTQEPKKRHVDLDAGCDRGFTLYGEGNKMQMDDLILCEDCLREAAKLIGMEHEDRVTLIANERDEAVRLQDIAESEKRKEAEYAARLEDAFDHRERPVKVKHQSRPRKVRAQEDE